MRSRGIRVDYDTSGSIGRRYRRNDEVGTPYCVTVDYETLEQGTVTIRDRDSMKQVKLNRRAAFRRPRRPPRRRQEVRRRRCTLWQRSLLKSNNRRHNWNEFSF